MIAEFPALLIAQLGEVRIMDAIVLYTGLTGHTTR